jgi:ATP-dependent RNA helicase DDX24/MAK5
MEIDLHMLDKLKTRVQVAKKIDNMRHKVSKANHEKKWLHEAAEAMEIQLDSRFSSLSLAIIISLNSFFPHYSEEENKSGPTKRERNLENAKTAALKLELRQLLSQPLISQGVSTRYITSGNRPIADELLAGDRESLF